MNLVSTGIIKKAALAGAASLAFSFGAAHASLMHYTANLVDINNTGASGNASLVYDTDAHQLMVTIDASGLSDGIHVQHIHGLFDDSGDNADSMTPTMADDADHDGFIELNEAAPQYGPILLSLSNPPGKDPLGTEGGFPTTSSYHYEETFDLTDSIFATNPATSQPFTAADLMPLYFREIVIHGAQLANGDGAGDGEADGTAHYAAVLPVLAGEITPSEVPLPAAGLLMLTGFAGFPFFRKRKAKRA